MTTAFPALVAGRLGTDRFSLLDVGCGKGFLVEALRVYHRYLGDGFTVECPTGSGRHMHLADVADELGRRLTAIFLRREDGSRPVFGSYELLQRDPAWSDLIPFHEYFHGDTGAGIGASHQTGWTGLVADLIIRRDRH